MESDKIYIDEENTHLIWGLIAVVCIAAATYMLTNAFMAGSWHIAGYVQIISLGLFSIGFYAIIRLTSPLLHFELTVSGSVLIIKAWLDSDEPISVQKISLSSIAEMRIAPDTPRSPNEALFDFSTSYHLMYRVHSSNEQKRLINPENKSFTLKVNDIKKIVQYVRSYNPEIIIPDDQKIYFWFPSK